MNAPTTFTSSTRRKSSSGYSGVGTIAPCIPALFQHASIRPKAATPAPTAASTLSLLRTSHTIARTAPPPPAAAAAVATAATVSSSARCDMASATTLAPRDAK